MNGINKTVSSQGSINTKSAEAVQRITEHENPLSLLYGWRLRLVTTSIALAMFLVNIEVSVVATSLVSIVNDLQGFERVGWVVTSYLITYTSLMIIWTKSSNFFGRKTCMISTLFIFVAFSAACGGSQTMTQLIIFRAFQGIGAAGCMSLGLTIAYEMVPRHKYPQYAAILSSVSAFGSLIGPLVGGAFSQRVSWRWIFLINVPFGLIVCVLLVFSIPNGFPYHGQETYLSRQGFSWSVITLAKRLDIIGGGCLLGASLLLVTALLEAGVTFPWKSAPTISLLTLAGLLCFAFVLQEYCLSRSKNTLKDPIFPWEFFKNRKWMGVLLLSLLSGAPYIVAMIDIPQRFQLFGTDAIGAGARLIPFNLLIALGAVVVNIIVSQLKIPPMILLLIGVALQIIGITLISLMDNVDNVPTAIFAYQVLAGLGIGIIFGICLILPPATISTEDFALCAGAVLQSRVLGGALGLAIASTVWNNYATEQLKHLLPPDQLSLVLKSTVAISLLPETVREDVIKVMIHSYNLRMKVLIGFTAAQFLAAGMLWNIGRIPITEENITMNDKSQTRFDDETIAASTKVE